MEPIISFQNFSFRYLNLKEETLKNINLTINKGEKVLIAGPSGSGKSTIAHCINGLIPLSYSGEIKGSLKVNGITPSSSSIFEVSNSVGTILQDQDAQFVGLSVGEDVAFSSENNMVSIEDMRKGVSKALNMVNMQDFINSSPYELSGGQKQRVSLAGILSTDAPILLFDEPLANLDPASGKMAMELISKIHKDTNKTIIIIEHRIEEVLEQDFDKIVIVANGELQAIGTPNEILKKDILRTVGLREPLYIEAIKHANCFIGKNDDISSLNKLNLTEYKSHILNWYNNCNIKNTKNTNQQVLRIKDLTFGYEKDKTILHNISLELNEGEMIAILGNNGAGKSTLSKLISGIHENYKGDIYLYDENINSWSCGKRGKSIGYVMQNPNHMITNHMIWDEIAFGLKLRGYKKDAISQKVEETLKICGLHEYRNWPVDSLSYGQKKRLTIASIIVLEPKVLILDEPTAGQDYRNYKEFMKFINSLCKKGISIILITHDMHLALEYADRAIVISEGTKIADDKVSNVFADKDVIKKANLKETSLCSLAYSLNIEDPNSFIQCFINHEKKENIYE